MKTSDYKQTATYWGIPTSDGWGSMTFPTPILLTVRWEERNEQFIDLDGEEVLSKAVVWVKSKVDLGGYMALGDHTGVSDPTTLNDASAIRQYREIPDLRNLWSEKRAFLR